MQKNKQKTKHVDIVCLLKKKNCMKCPGIIDTVHVQSYLYILFTD